MLYVYKLTNFLIKNKEDYTNCEFNSKFYRNIKLSGLGYEENQFDLILNDLYKMDIDNYKKWFEVFKEIAYTFVKNNTEEVEKIITSNDIEKIRIAYDMDKKKRALINRAIPMRVNITTVNEHGEKVLSNLNQMLSDISEDNENNPVKTVQENFKSTYGMYENDIVLGSLYSKNINSFKQELLSLIKFEVKKVEGCKRMILDQVSPTVIRNDYKLNGIDARLPKTSEKIYYK